MFADDYVILYSEKVNRDGENYIAIILFEKSFYVFLH